MDMKMKHLIPIMVTSVIAAATSFAQPPPPAPVAATEQIAVIVSMYLLNLRGEVTGLLLVDGTELPRLNESLKTQGQQPIAIPPTKVALNHEALSSGRGVDRRVGREAPRLGGSLPDNFRL